MPIPVTPGAIPMRMTSAERHATAGLAGIYGLRLLGMFIVLPVFALYAETLPGGASRTLIGVALGAYGLTQALLQIPFGWASDTWGRKPVIYMGLAIFALGSFVAAVAPDIGWTIAGRCLQGAGAISAAVLALTADLTREIVRTRAMAVIGITIAATFALSLVAGPLLMALIGVPGIFVATGLLALLAAALLRFAIPEPRGTSRERPLISRALLDVARHPQLLRLNFGSFALHASLMALFTQVPFALRDNGLAVERHWLVYLPVLLVSIAIMLPLLRQVDRPSRSKQILLCGVGVLLLAQIALPLSLHSLPAMIGALIMFFAALNLLEAMLPSLVSKCAPAGARGAAIGINSSMQFLGAFAGAAAGGWLAEHTGGASIFIPGVALTATWLIAALTMSTSPNPCRSNYSMGET